MLTEQPRYETKTTLCSEKWISPPSGTQKDIQHLQYAVHDRCSSHDAFLILLLPLYFFHTPSAFRLGVRPHQATPPTPPSLILGYPASPIPRNTAVRATTVHPE